MPNLSSSTSIRQYYLSDKLYHFSLRWGTKTYNKRLISKKPLPTKTVEKGY